MTVNPMKTAVDSLFNRLGRAATYKNSSVRLILSEPDEITEVGFVQCPFRHASGKDQNFRCAGFKVGDKIGMDGKIYAVRSEPLSETSTI